MDQDILRHTIRRKLEAGSLPHDSIPRIWGGPATGEECDACGELITTEFLIEGISTADNQGLQLHVECFYIWDEARDVPGRR